jgi:hypothetical protein
VAKEKRIHDYIYVNGTVRKQCFITYGLTFKEYMKVFGPKIQHILLIKHQFDFGTLNYHTFLEYVDEDNMKQLLEDEVHRYGDFCWVDFDDTSSLDLLEPMEIAELLYLGHKKHPVTTAFYSKLNNRLAYLSYQDGWFNKIFYKDMEDFYQVLECLIPLKVNERLKKKFHLFQKQKSLPCLPVEISHSLSRLSEQGLLIDFTDIQENRKTFQIPVYTIGKFLNMDDMIEQISELKMDAAFKGQLIYLKKSQIWSLHKE